MKKKKAENQAADKQLNMSARVLQTWTAARRMRYPLISKRAREKGKKNGRK